jgi:hypothetical protein
MTKSSKILSAVLAGSLVMGSVATAFAASPLVGYQSTFGQIKEISGAVITLTDGSQFSVPYGFDASHLRVGEKVNVVWMPDGSSTTQRDGVANLVSTITLADPTIRLQGPAPPRQGKARFPCGEPGFLHRAGRIRP